MYSRCPNCDAVPITLQRMQADNAALRAQVTSLQEHNTAEVERRRKAEVDLGAILCLGGPGPLGLILQELRKAKLKYPHFAINVEEAFAVLASEHGELATAILKSDVHGEHGIIREAAQVAAVAIRIIEFHQPMEVPNA
ncbi:MAG: hypothetical protein KKF77_01340 [Proteobacteria bacterium]|nr:hypothetical protein [Pseudomonadota bacterium]